MVTDNHYRWDFIGLSTDDKPTPATSPKVVDGSTFYCSDNSKLYVYCKNQWYEKTATGGSSYTAGTGITIADDTISVDTTTIQPKLTAGSNVTIADNTISATDTTYSAFTGTDGVDAGTSGLVPAPAITDVDKFLKSDGTWSEAGGSISGAIALTTADYNYPANNPNGIAPWLLAPGLYYLSQNNMNFYYNSGSAGTTSGVGFYVVRDWGGKKSVLRLNNNNTWNYTDYTTTGSSNQTYTLLGNDIVKQTTGSGQSDLMSQKAITDTINNRLDDLTLLVISETDYGNLVTKDPHTLYIITGA